MLLLLLAVGLDHLQAAVAIIVVQHNEQSLKLPRKIGTNHLVDSNEVIVREGRLEGGRCLNEGVVPDPVPGVEGGLGDELRPRLVATDSVG